MTTTLIVPGLDGVHPHHHRADFQPHARMADRSHNDRAERIAS